MTSQIGQYLMFISKTSPVSLTTQKSKKIPHSQNFFVIRGENSEKSVASVILGTQFRAKGLVANVNSGPLKRIAFFLPMSSQSRYVQAMPGPRIARAQSLRKSRFIPTPQREPWPRARSMTPGPANRRRKATRPQNQSSLRRLSSKPRAASSIRSSTYSKPASPP